MCTGVQLTLLQQSAWGLGDSWPRSKTASRARYWSGACTARPRWNLSHFFCSNYPQLLHQKIGSKVPSFDQNDPKSLCFKQIISPRQIQASPGHPNMLRRLMYFLHEPVDAGDRVADQAVVLRPFLRGSLQ